MKKLTNIPSVTLPALALVVIASLLLIFESDFLWKLQELNLFLSSKIFFKEQMVEPGGFLTWISTWFTQVFFHPWMGVLLLCGWWTLLMWLVKKAFRVSSRWMPVIILPVLFLLVTIVDTGYWIYVLKLRGHVFLGTIGTTAVVALLWAFRSLVERVKPTWLHCLFVLMTCAVGYPLLGIYGLAATALMAVWIWRLEQRRLPALAVSLTGLLSVGLLPLLFYRFVYYQTNVANIYYARLPLYYVTKAYTSFYIPFALLLLFFLAMVCLSSRPTPNPSRGGRGAATAQPSDDSESLPLTGERRGGLLALLLLLAAAVYTACFWYHDENFHHELAMQRQIDHQDWEGVLKEAAKQKDTPTRAIVMMRNLALARLERQGDEMYHYKNGCKKCDAPFDIRAVNTVGTLIYYHYGIPNHSYRLCMEKGVEFGWRAEHLKYIARSSVLNGDMQLARKYLGLLKQTMFHGTWADHVYELTEHAKNIRKDNEMGFIKHMMHFDDSLIADHNLVENFLMRRLIDTRYTGDPLFIEQKLYATMWAKDTSGFWRHLYDYARLYPDRQWPIHIQEAAILFSTLEKKRMMDQWPISQTVRDSYRRFTETASRVQGADWDTAHKVLYPNFGQTYFYDCYMISFPAQN